MFFFLLLEKHPTIFSTCTECEGIFMGLCGESLDPEFKFR